MPALTAAPCRRRADAPIRTGARYLGKRELTDMSRARRCSSIHERACVLAIRLRKGAIVGRPANLASRIVRAIAALANRRFGVVIRVGVAETSRPTPTGIAAHAAESRGHRTR